MKMQLCGWSVDEDTQPKLGLIVLQNDQTIEVDYRRLFPPNTQLYVTRIACNSVITNDSLQQMEQDLQQSAGLLPNALRFAATGYACTSGSAQIGTKRVAQLITKGMQTEQVTDPVSALIAACRALGVKKLAMLTPYILEVSQNLIKAVSQNGISVASMGSFNVNDDAKVAVIDQQSIVSAALELTRPEEVDALFISCTNLRTMDAIAIIEKETGLPVLTSNQVLGWHLSQLSGCLLSQNNFGKLMSVSI